MATARALDLNFPPSAVLLDGQRTATAFATGSDRSSGSAATLADPIATHLLVETALGDCKRFEVLSFEELEALKKEDAALVSRIEGTRRKLVLETKVRDAARSLNRLYSNGKRTSGGPGTSPLLGRRNSASAKNDTMERAEVELNESSKKCDELSRELYYLEQRSRQTQMKLLQHTAAVLQNTYGNGHRQFNLLADGRPYSPDSMDGFETGNGWNVKGLNSKGLGPTANGDVLDGFLTELKSGTKQKPKDSAKSREAQLAVGKRLESLNAFVRDIIGQFNPQNSMVTTPPPKVDADPRSPDTAIFDQLNFLMGGLDEIKQEQRSLQAQRARSVPNTPMLQTQTNQLRSELETSIKENLALQREFDIAEDRMASMLEELNSRIFDIISQQSPADNIPTVPTVDRGPTEQLTYAQARLASISKLVQSHSVAAHHSRNASRAQDRSDQYEVVLQGLWQIIQAGEEDARDRKRLERANLASQRTRGEALDSEDDMSPDEDDGLPAEFSLAAFSTKVQWLVSKSNYLKEKQSNLRRRMQQMRQANDDARDAPRAADVTELRKELEKTNDMYATAKEELQDVESRAAQSQSRVAQLEAELTSAIQTREQGVAAQSRAQKAEQELQSLESEVVRLTTELTIAKADLDAAYGSRQERAAEVAKAAESEAQARLDEATKRNDALNREVDSLRGELSAGGAASEREATLKSELQATLKDFEGLTKASVEAEKEREDLEQMIDKLRDQIDHLESQLSDDKVAKLGMKSPESEGSLPTQTTSTLTLKNEFKKMMRDTRAEHQKALKVMHPTRCAAVLSDPCANVVS
jgi:hypothetical protein